MISGSAIFTLLYFGLFSGFADFGEALLAAEYAQVGNSMLYNWTDVSRVLAGNR
jgi:hypothetical protein